MEKKNIIKLNKASKDIWTNLELSIKTNNPALIEKNLKRLASLQKYYSELLNFQDYEIISLQNDLSLERLKNVQLEKEWFIEVTKKTGTYNEMKLRIDEIFI